MRIECEQCTTLTHAHVSVSASGEVHVTCDSCGHVMALPASDPTPPKESASEEIFTPKPSAPEALSQPPAGFSSRLASPSTLRAFEAASNIAALSKTLSPPEVADPLKAPLDLQIDPGQGDVRCPKCGYRQDEATSCHRCGLALDRDVAQEGAWDMFSPEQAAHADEFEARWKAVEESDFGDEDAHKALLQYAAATKLLEHAARRYRFFLQDHPDDPRSQGATQALASIVELLHAQFLTSHRVGEGSSAAFVEDAARVRRGITVVAVFMCIGVLFLAVYIFGPF